MCKFALCCLKSLEIILLKFYKPTTMAKAAKTAIKTKDQKAASEAKNWTKVIRAIRSPKTGAYTFKEAIVHKEKIKEYLAQK